MLLKYIFIALPQIFATKFCCYCSDKICSSFSPEAFIKTKFDYLFYKLTKFRAVPQSPEEIHFATELNHC